MNTKGKPKAAMWEGVLPVSMAPTGIADGGWRQVQADGVSKLEGDCFLAVRSRAVRPRFHPRPDRRLAAPVFVRSRPRAPLPCPRLLLLAARRLRPLGSRAGIGWHRRLTPLRR